MRERGEIEEIKRKREEERKIVCVRKGGGDRGRERERGRGESECERGIEREICLFNIINTWSVLYTPPPPPPVSDRPCSQLTLLSV